MKTTLAIALALGLGVAATGFAVDTQNSKQALVTYGKMELKEKSIEKIAVVEKRAAPEKKATVAVTRDISTSPTDRDLGAAEAVSAHSSKGEGLTFK